MKTHNDMVFPKREQNSNKGTFGTVLNVSGSNEYSGAAILSSVAALKSGAGKVILCSSENTLTAASFQVPELVLIKRQKINFSGISSVILGCGLSQDNDAVETFWHTLDNIRNLPLVIDADGLNILSKNNCKLPPNTILTPHPKEMSRLMNISVDDILKNPKEVTLKCVEKYSATVVLKLHNTLVANKDKNIYINNTGNSALAKAGSGDVLAGIIGGFLAQGLDCFNAAKTGVFVHGLAGELASKDLSEYSVLASDLNNYIGKAFKTYFDILE
ncbi:NAD(P)H-hydrate dehydratase [bacterium]|nr:NAD(P)H-hydrate dehydratase [bacterium]